MKTLFKISLAAVLSATATMASGFGQASNNAQSQYLKGTNGSLHQYVICTALNGQSYHTAGKNIADSMGFDPKTGLKYARPETTDGTKQNYDLMKAGACNVAVMQGDYLAYLKGKDPKFFTGKSLYRLSRTENVQLIQRDGDDEDDIQGNNANIHLGLRGSGGDASYSPIIALDDGYKSTNLHYGDIDASTLEDLANGEIDAIIRTSHLDPDNDEIARLVAKNDKIHFSDFDDMSLNNSVDFGKGKVQTYEFKKTVVDSHGWDTKAWTLQTNVVVVVDKSRMSSIQKSRLSKVFLKDTNLFKKNTSSDTSGNTLQPTAAKHAPSSNYYSQGAHDYGEASYNRPSESSKPYESDYSGTSYTSSSSSGSSEEGYSTGSVIAAGLGGAIVGNMMSSSSRDSVSTPTNTYSQPQQRSWKQKMKEKKAKWKKKQKLKKAKKRAKKRRKSRR